MHSNSTIRALLVAISALSSALAGCSSDAGTGSLTVLIEAEDVITEGLEPGTDGESIQDGWAVSFDKYIVAIGDVDVHLATNESVFAEAAEVHVVDLVQVPASGLELAQLNELRAGRWEFNYATPIAESTSTRHSSVSTTDFDLMVAEGLTYLVEGELMATDGESCPPSSLATPGTNTPNGTTGPNPCYDATTIAFRFGAAAPDDLRTLRDRRSPRVRDQ